MVKKIMTVDDSASVRQMVCFTLKMAGYDVIEARDGVEALGKLEREDVSMMIADVNMPHLNGIDLVRKVRETGSHKFIPIILLTTEASREKKQEGAKAGATGWMVKPFRPDELLSVVKKVLG